jgi:hypothetical protein
MKIWDHPSQTVRKKTQILSINLRFLLFSSELVLAAPVAIEMNPH